MHHPIFSASFYQGHIPISLVLKSLLFAALIVFHCVALLIITALGFVLSLAIRERLHKLHRQQVPLRPAAAYWVSDGGSFPGSEPKSERSPRSRPSVIDGGSLERYKH